MFFAVFSKYMLTEKIVIDGSSHNIITKLRQVPYFHDMKVMFACFHSNETIQPFIILILQRPKGTLHKFLMMDSPMGCLTNKFNSIIFNSLSLLLTLYINRYPFEDNPVVSEEDCTFCGQEG